LAFLIYVGKPFKKTELLSPIRPIFLRPAEGIFRTLHPPDFS